MDMLKNKSIIVLAILIMGVSYLTALDNTTASHKTQKNEKIISENK